MLKVVITVADMLYRRIFHFCIVTHENNRISSSAFKNKKGRPDPKCSVFLDGIMVDPLEPMRTAVDGQYLTMFPASVPLQCALPVPVIHTPSPMEGIEEPSHCEMIISTKEQCDTIAAAAELIDPISKRKLSTSEYQEFKWLVSKHTTTN